MRSCVPLLFLTAMAATLAAQDVLLNYGSMVSNSDGRIDYRLVAVFKRLPIVTTAPPK